MAFAKTRMFSEVLGLCVTCDVILPQRTDMEPDKKLPVLWLLHGAHGNYADWTRLTSIERYVRPYGLAVVMPSAQNSCYTDMAHGRKYYTYISEELPKLMRQFYNFSDKREDNFIAGLSMGGMGSLMLGLANPEKYAVIGCLSAGLVNEEGSFGHGQRFEMTFGDGYTPGTYKDPYGNARKIIEQGLPCPRVFHACGADDFLLASAHKTRDFFRSFPNDPFEYRYAESPGAHTWDFWDDHIRQFIEFLHLPIRREEYR